MFPPGTSASAATLPAALGRHELRLEGAPSHWHGLWMDVLAAHCTRSGSVSLPPALRRDQARRDATRRGR